MDEKEKKGFPWAGCFFVSGICFLVFSVLMHLLDGISISLFRNTGFVSLGLSVVFFLNEWLSEKFIGARSNMSSQQEQAA